MNEEPPLNLHQRASQSAEDFMDEEDLKAFGGKQLQASKEYEGAPALPVPAFVFVCLRDGLLQWRGSLARVANVSPQA